jgi:hypothetical protein
MTEINNNGKSFMVYNNNTPTLINLCDFVDMPDKKYKDIKIEKNKNTGFYELFIVDIHDKKIILKEFDVNDSIMQGFGLGGNPLYMLREINKKYIINISNIYNQEYGINPAGSDRL